MPATKVLSMKSMILTAFLLLIIAPLGADTSMPKQERSELKTTMHSFVTALDMIQDGILYNRSEAMKEGIAILKRTEQGFMERHGSTLQRYMNKDPNFALSYARITADKLRHHIQSLDNEVRYSKEYAQTAATYGRIIQLCTECHQKFRK